MNCSPTLTAEEFKVLHNTLWELGNIDNPRVQTLVERIRTVALKGAYEQDQTQFEGRHDYYSAFQRDNGLQSIWSVYELPVHGFLANHPYPSDSFIVYQGHHCAVWGSTWADIYRAADQAIRNSGDDHHCFIEGFEVKNGNELHLYTGS